MKAAFLIQFVYKSPARSCDRSTDDVWSTAVLRWDWATCYILLLYGVKISDVQVCLCQQQQSKIIICCDLKLHYLAEQLWGKMSWSIIYPWVICVWAGHGTLWYLVGSFSIKLIRFEKYCRSNKLSRLSWRQFIPSPRLLRGSPLRSALQSPLQSVWAFILCIWKWGPTQILT